MQIVIEIPKYVYDAILAHNGYISDCDNEKVGKAISHGTLLPKGHGRLIDAYKLQNNISHDEREAFTKHQVWLKASIYNPDAPTIIGADRSESEG